MEPEPAAEPEPAKFLSVDLDADEPAEQPTKTVAVGLVKIPETPAVAKSNNGKLEITVDQTDQSGGPGFEVMMSEAKNMYGIGTKAVVKRVERGSSADKLKVGDIILEIGGVSLTMCPPGQCAVLLKVRRISVPPPCTML